MSIIDIEADDLTTIERMSERVVLRLPPSAHGYLVRRTATGIEIAPDSDMGRAMASAGADDET